MVIELNKQPEVNIGMIGHVDHGKTTLVQALTGVWTARHSEELKRAMTIKLGYADGVIGYCKNLQEPESYTTERSCPDGSEPEILRRVSYVDAPGHEILMATVLSGAALMDGAILVISATDPCPQPQTREHLIAVKLIGVRNIVVVQNKVDAVSKERALKNYEEIRRFLEEMGYRDLPVIPVSALHKINIDALLMHIQKYIPTPERDVRAKPLFLIARSFDVNRPGTPYEKLVGGVIGGSVVRGVFRVGDEIEIKPGIEIRESSGKTYYKPLQTRIASIRFGNEEFTEARPGGLAAFGTKLDPFYTKADKLVGGFVSLAGELPEPEYEFTIRYSLLERVVGVKEMLKMTPLKTRERILISIGTLTTFATINRISDEIMELTSQKPVIALKDFSVAISRQIAGRWRIAGYGKIV
ncbi:MAG: translation initiation factor IF-2 subunit gamma [Sulfolobales archaeon]